MKQLNNALKYNQQYHHHPTLNQQPHNSLWRRLPHACAVQKQNNNTPTDTILSETFDRFFKIINSNQCGDFCRLMDILFSKDGVLCIESNEKLIKFEFELKKIT